MIDPADPHTPLPPDQLPPDQQSVDANAALYPVMLDLRDRDVLVVGGGPIAARKAEGLLASGALVCAVAPQFSAEWETLMRGYESRLQRLARRYQSDDLAGRWLVITATDDAAVQQLVADDGRARNIWVNAADDPQRCTFILPAVHREGPVVVAVSTSGTAPAFAGWLRDRLRNALPSGVADVARRLRVERDAMHAVGQSTEQIDWRPRIDALVSEAATQPQERP